MANRSRITVRLNQAEVGKLLKSAEVRKVLQSAGDEMATDVENRYQADGKDYTFDAWQAETSQRARVIVGSKDGDHARYSEAARGHLLDEANKKRDLP